jgi:hypothetical protein
MRNIQTYLDGVGQILTLGGNIDPIVTLCVVGFLIAAAFLVIERRHRRAR